MIRAGRCRHYVSVEKLTRGIADAYGHRPETWASVARVWASIEPFSSNEGDESKQIRWTTKYRVLLREPVASLTTECRIKWGERILHIEQVLDMEGRGVEFQLVCQEKT